MKILGKNLKAGEVRLEITNNEDLWYLSHILSKGDLIRGSTERKIKIGSDEKAKVVRKPCTLTIRVEKVEYDSNLRALGIITDGPDDIPRGEHHSFNIQPRDKIKVTRKWYKHELQKLEEAEKEQTNILLVVFDREEAKFAHLKKSGYEELSEIKGDVTKKADEKETKNNFYKEISKQIEEYKQRLQIKQIIIASPAFWKEYLLKELDDKTKKQTITATISGVNKGAFKELLQRPELQTALQSERATKELKAIEEIMTGIAKEKAFYGEKESKEKIEQGAAKKLIIAEEYLKKKKDENKYDEVDKLLQTAEGTKTDIIIIGSKEPEQKLMSLGGIAGILRW